MIDWSVYEIKEADIRTRKHLTITGNLHPNGGVDKLYLPRSQGAQGIKMIAGMFESRIISIGQYLTITRNCSNAINFVFLQKQM